MVARRLVRIGDVGDVTVERLAEDLRATRGLDFAVDPEPIDPAPAFTPARGQYDSRKLMAALDAIRGDDVVVGVADVDLFASIFTHVFGEAHLGGTVALVSMHRLRPEMYGLPSDPELLRQRLLTETVHEFGHLLGAVHCSTPGCVMTFSGAVEEIDLKSPDPCHDCADRFTVSR